MPYLDSWTLAGGAGAASIVAAYFANQQRWLSSEDWRFPLANLVGAGLILVSLAHDLNVPSVIMETFWFAISLWGLAKGRLRRHKP